MSMMQVEDSQAQRKITNQKESASFKQGAHARNTAMPTAYLQKK
jgi:hypothetical protein